MLYDWQVEEFFILVIMLRLAKPPLLHLANVKTRTKAKKIPLFKVQQFVLFSTVNQNQKLESLLPLLIKNPPSYHITQQIHSHMIVNGLLNHSMLLLNTLLRCYSFSDFACKAFLLYKQFQQVCSQSPSFPRPSFDSFTYTFLLNASAGLCHPVMGTQLHCLTEKLGFQCHIYVQTALVNMYVSCGVLREAMQVFDEMPQRNSVTWNIMITGFTKWGELETARSLFDKMPDRTVVSWTGIIDGYTRMNRHGEAVALFREMVASDIKPTEITMLAIFPSVRSDLKICQSIHGYIEKSGFDGCDIRVSNSLIDTYAKCGCIMSASRFFEEINDERKNLVSWTSIISGFAMHGMGKEAVESFERMEKIGLKPNRVALLSLLNACSHAGLVELGLNLFNRLVDEYQVSPDIKHYGCLIDMLGRAGRLEEAEKMALEIPNEIVNDVIWRTLLSACSFHGATEMGERATRKIMEIEKGYGVDYVLMSNIFASAGRFDDVEKLRRLLDERNVLKLPGKSLL